MARKFGRGIAVAWVHSSMPQPAPDAKPDALDAARAAGLRYVADSAPGLRRARRGSSFKIEDAAGRPVDDEAIRARIRSLAIPPAWREVWICPTAQGHLQATGRDEKGRKQYRYHPKWRSTRDESKYGRMVDFAHALVNVRRRTGRDLARPGLPRQQVLAAVVRLLESTLIRVGNAEYARQNNHFGLSTMRDRHVAVDGATLRFQFTGKSGVRHAVDLEDRRLAKIVKACRDLPGQDLFQYRDDDGNLHAIGSADVNEYLREAAGGDYTAKDFRTWAGTVLAAMALQEFEAFDSETQAKRNIVRAIEQVSSRLGNTPSVCRKCYVHPAILDAYLDGSMVHALRERADAAMGDDLKDLKPEEAAVLVLLQRRLAAEDRPRSPRRGQPRSATGM